MTTNPFIHYSNPDGSTDVEGFLREYEKDDNFFWMTPTGHIQNVLDALIEENKRLRNIVLYLSTELGRINMREVLDKLADL